MSFQIIPNISENLVDLLSPDKQGRFLKLTQRWWSWLNQFSAIGQPIAPAFAAGNFAGGGSQTWAVTSLGVAAYSYSLVGNTMLLNFSVSGTVGGVANPELLIALPVKSTPAYTCVVPISILNGGVWSASVAVANAGGVNLIAYANPNFTSLWTAGTATVQGQITIPLVSKP